ncbi:MAG TPA: DUF4252 domain-containing protein [Terracidiphilus sp.]|nr:DUF4252 domain-containing protein [Terracidiphilus sp.]
MKSKVCLVVAAAALASGLAFAQEQLAGNSVAPDPAVSLSPVPLEWTPPALAWLSARATMKESFTLDRDMLGMAAALVPDSETQDREVIRKLDGVSVHTMRFSDAGIPDQSAVNAIRDAYHLRGWKHLVTSTRTGGPVHDNTTDVWVVMDGVNIRGAVVLAETPRSLTLVTVAGNLDPVDLLHLRGHFGIPRFGGDSLSDQRVR